MSYRKILLPLIGGESDAHLSKVALSIASTFGSHVAALCIKLCV